MAAAAKTRPNEAERHDNPADPLTGETLYQYLERTATQRRHSPDDCVAGTGEDHRASRHAHRG